MRNLLILLATCVIAVTTLNVHAAEKRVALVIGNAAYAASPLANPVNDARAIAARLKNLGFEVVERENVTTKQIGSTLREFRSRLAPGTEALFFYAGHGLQVKGINYLPAVDADIAAEEDVPTQSIDVNKVLEIMEDSKTRLNLVFLDACRNNPFTRRFRSADGGLAKMNAPSGTILSFATRPGSVASDGEGSNGLYTEHLLLAMADKNLPIEQALKKVHAGVKRASKGKQEPWQEGGIEGEFYFIYVAPGGAVNIQSGSKTPSPAAPSSAGLNLDDLKKEQESRAQWNEWQKRMQKDFEDVTGFSDTADLEAVAWERFLAAYAQDNPFSTEDDSLRTRARARLAEAKARGEETKRAEAELHPGKVFKDCADCPEMVVIPAGHFIMGSPSDEKGRDSNEGPQHEVNVGSFALGKHEVTQGQWRAIMGNNPIEFKDCGDTCPVDQVSWKDAQEFIAKLNARTGKQYRLPSEVEWEYAARASSTTARYWGNNPGDACRYANVHDATSKRINGYSWEAHACDDGEAKTARAGKYAANAFGLHDMIGNVWEWVEDCYHDSYSGAPTDGSAWTSGKCDLRVLRGGSWIDSPVRARSAKRNGVDSSKRVVIAGFRLARMLP